MWRLGASVDADFNTSVHPIFELLFVTVTKNLSTFRSGENGRDASYNLVEYLAS